MWIEMNPLFREEAEAFRLDFTCEACGNWMPDQDACSILYPHEPHRADFVASRKDGDRIYFCKMFESR